MSLFPKCEVPLRIKIRRNNFGVLFVAVAFRNVIHQTCSSESISPQCDLSINQNLESKYGLL